jgi:nucleoside-diphosphate-sugar epimerase
VADGAIRAAEHPGAAGRAYNLSGPGEMTQREYLDLLTDTLGFPRVQRHLSLRTAHWGGFLAELIGIAIRLKRPPHWSRYVVNLITRPASYSNARARDELGWSPRVPVSEGFPQTLAWYRAEQALNPLLP